MAENKRFKASRKAALKRWEKKRDELKECIRIWGEEFYGEEQLNLEKEKLYLSKEKISEKYGFQ